MDNKASVDYYLYL